MAQKPYLSEAFVPGQRVLAATRGQNPREVGLGTHLWNGEILLDNGTKILDRDCRATPAEQTPVPPFEIVLQKPAQVYDAVDHGLRMTRHWLHDGERLKVLSLERKLWNHGTYVAGKIMYRGVEHWLVMSHTALPWAQVEKTADA